MNQFNWECENYVDSKMTDYEAELTKFRDFTPNYTIKFLKDGDEVGCFDFSNAPITFTGDADTSAKVFIDSVCKMWQHYPNVNTAKELSARIKEYLWVGGMWNPECMEHDKVRDLLMECRTLLDTI